MDTNIKLPTTNLSIFQIARAIGIGEVKDLSHLVLRARERGISPSDNKKISYAFRISQLGYTHSDGELACDSNGDNSAPYFNIFSQNSPSEWTFEYGEVWGESRVYCRLKRNQFGDIALNGVVADENCYSINLGDFRGYNHHASAPTAWIESVTHQESAENYKVSVVLKTGEIDWIKAIASTPSNIDRTTFAICATLYHEGQKENSSIYISLDTVQQSENGARFEVLSAYSNGFSVEFEMIEVIVGIFTVKGNLPLGIKGKFNTFTYKLDL